MTRRANPSLTLLLVLTALAAIVPTAAQAQFTTETKLTASDAAEFDYFGGSVAISGDTAIVGEDHNDNGSAYIFGRNHGGDGDWGEVAKLTASDAAAGDQFGGSVAISGDVAIVGASGNDTDSGSAYIYTPEPGALTLVLGGLALLSAAPRTTRVRSTARVR